jgi:hypothetical protein
MRKRGGFALIVALSLVFIVFTVAISLQYWTSLSRAAYFQSEAEFQAELSLENQVAADFLRLRQVEARPGSAPDVGLKQSDGFDTDLRLSAGGQVFEKKLPSPAFKKPDRKVVEGQGQQIFKEYQPTSMRPEFRVFGKGRFSLVYSTSFPCAAYAPRGKIDLEQCFPGGNPPEGKKIQGKPEEFRSGVPAVVAAKGLISVSGDFPYGEAYTEEKELKLGKPGGVLAHFGKLPMAEYSGRIDAQLKGAFAELSRADENGDKSKFLMGKAILTPRGIVNCLFSMGEVSLDDVLGALVTPSLNQSMAFPLPVIPTFSTAVLYNELTFHMPFPPDQGLYAPLQKQAERLASEVGGKLNSLGDPLYKAQEKLAKLKQEVDAKVNEAVNKAVGQAQGALSNAQNALSSAQNRVSSANSRLSRVQADLAKDPSSKPAQDAVAAAQAEVNSANSALQSVQDQLAAAQNQVNKAGDEARAAIMAQYQPALDQAQATLNQLAQQVQELSAQAQAFAKESANQLAAALPGDPAGLKTRAEEAVAAIDETLGAPGMNYLALGLLFGHASLNAEQRALEQACFKLALKFVQLIAPGGKLTLRVTSPGEFVKISLDFTIPSVLLDPTILEAAYRLRHLSIKEALLEYLQPILDSIPFNEVRLVNFGDPDNPTDETFKFDNSGTDTLAKGMTSECTWNVPPGRTLTLRGDMVIKGDLWVQNGASMHVKGNLKVVAPAPRSFRGIDNPLSPSGRIFLEPGASLLVDKDLSVEGGSALFGSVVAEAPLGQASALTCAILCQGNVNLKYGVHPGINLDHLFGYFAEKAGGADLLRIQKQVLHPLLTTVAPNAAKIFGPFHIRKPYISSSATTLSLYFIIPGPGPPYPNIMVKVFRVLASAYGISLNAALGENLVTQCDWWIFGDGAVPIVPRVDGETLLQSLKGIRFPVPNVSDPVAFFKQRLQSFVTKVVIKVTTDAISTCVGELIKAVTSVLQIGKQVTAAVGAVIDGVLAQFKTSVNQLIEEMKQEFELAVTDAVKELVEKPVRQIIDDLLHQVEASLERSVLRDAPGVLIQAGGSVTIGESPLSLGMFVARKDVTIGSERCVGSLFSFEGNIKARRLDFLPHFTSASLYVPKAGPDWTSAGWPAAAVEVEYGADCASGKSVDIGPSVYHVTSQGWTQ